MGYRNDFDDLDAPPRRDRRDDDRRDGGGDRYDGRDRRDDPPPRRDDPHGDGWFDGRGVDAEACRLAAREAENADNAEGPDERWCWPAGWYTARITGAQDEVQSKGGDATMLVLELEAERDDGRTQRLTHYLTYRHRSSRQAEQIGNRTIGKLLGAVDYRARGGPRKLDPRYLDGEVRVKLKEESWTGTDGSKRWSNKPSDYGRSRSRPEPRDDRGHHDGRDRYDDRR